MVMGSTLVCGDTSFLLSLYATDVHTPNAIADAQRAGRLSTVTSLNVCELSNALRLAEFRRVLPHGQATAYLQAFQTDLAAGEMTWAACDLGSVIVSAERISADHTLAGGYRGFDILHVAAARYLGAFLSCDARQRELAAAEGLAVGPVA